MSTDDLISRQAALDAFGLSEKTRKYGGDYSGYDTMMLYEIQQTLEDLPSVTSKQRPGAWVYDSFCGGFYQCSVCGYDQGRKTNYCPKCGAKMVEVHDDD